MTKDNFYSGALSAEILYGLYVSLSQGQYPEKRYTANSSVGI